MRRIIYGISLWAFLAATACTLSALILPSWITYTSPPTDPSAAPIHISYGLHKRCSSLTNLCTPFPAHEDCLGKDKAFCGIWRSAGFLMNFAVVLELACLVAFVTVIVGGRGSREGGWKVLGGLLGLVGLAEMGAMALVAYLYDHDNRFFVGWELDKAWILCTVSWTVLVIDALALVVARFVLPKEDDYEMIP